MYNAYQYYCNSLPELLLDLSKRVIEAGETVPDGYYNFKRVIENKLVIYRMYCTYLNFKKLNEIQVSQIKDCNELLNSKWRVYNFDENSQTYQYYLEFGPELDKDGLGKLTKTRVNEKPIELQWKMNEDEVIDIYD